MIPGRLEDWTYDIIENLINKNINESERHDFKLTLPEPPKLRKICCAFANTKGGFIILGIKDRGSEFVIEGIDNDKELAHKFGQKITNIQPTIDPDLPRVINIPNSKKVLVVFHIPLSDERPHLPSAEDERIFWKRTNKGNAHMTYDEISMSFQRYEERREKIKLLYIELLSNIETLKEMKVDQSTQNISKSYSVLTLDSSIITSLLTDLYTIIGKNTELIKCLFIIRRNIQTINTKSRIFHSHISTPRTDLNQLVKEHNEFMNGQIDFLIPINEKAMDILEKRFNLQNPLNTEHGMGEGRNNDG